MFHLRAKVIGRSGGRSAGGAVAYRAGSTIAAASIAYRAGESLTDPASGRAFDYRAKGRLDANGYGVLHKEIMAPEGSPAWVYDLQNLVNKVEATEKRKDAQLFRELEVSLPRELSLEDQKALVRAFVERTCVREGMVAAIFIHNERASDGGDNPHAHILLTMRSIGPEGFGAKRREWNAAARVQDWREAWAQYANEFLLARGHAPRLDHRSHQERGLDVEPDNYIGPTKGRNFDGVVVAHRQAERTAGKARNLQKVSLDPQWALDQITRTQSTFTERDVAKFIHRYTAVTNQDDRFAELLAKVMQSPDLQKLAEAEGQKPARFTTRAMLAVETGLKATAERLAGRGTAFVLASDLAGLTPEQEKAAKAILAGRDLVALHGLAGTGKTHLLAKIAEAYAKAGHRVRGAALSGIVARSLGDAANVPSQTIASLLRDLEREKPFEPLNRGDVLIIDEAGMIGSRQLAKVLDHAERRGAKVVLVGDTQQLQAIEAGGAFRTIVKRHGAAELSTIQRQRHSWQRQASTDLARGAVPEALAAYRAQGSFHPSPTSSGAMQALIDRWHADRSAGQSQVILAHRRTETQALNRLARAKLRAEGLLGREVDVTVMVMEEENGEVAPRAVTRSFATGDRMLFTRNDKALGVQNGSLGTITSLTRQGAFKVRLDDGREVAFDAGRYSYLEQGYAMTVHKAQGATVDRAYVLAGEMFDAHMAYVALTRHRERVDVFYNRTDFPTDAKLMRTLARDRTKDTSIDYAFPIVVEADLPRVPPGVVTSGPINGDWSLLRGQEPSIVRDIGFGIGE